MTAPCCATIGPCRHTAARLWRHKTCRRRADLAVWPTADRSAGLSRASCVNCRNMEFTPTPGFLGSLVAATEGADLARGDPETRVAGITQDTRRLRPGDLF